MSTEIDRRLARLETLFAEQEHTIQSLDQVVSQQDQQLVKMALKLDRMRDQLFALKEATGSDIDPLVEQPPHY